MLLALLASLSLFALLLLLAFVSLSLSVAIGTGLRTLRGVTDKSCSRDISMND